MVPDAVDMMGELLGVCVGLVLRFCLLYCQYRISFVADCRYTDRDNMHIEISLATLLLAPLSNLWVPSGNEAKALRRI